MIDTVLNYDSDDSDDSDDNNDNNDNNEDDDDNNDINIHQQFILDKINKKHNQLFDWLYKNKKHLFTEEIIQKIILDGTIYSSDWLKQNIKNYDQIILDLNIDI